MAALGMLVYERAHAFYRGFWKDRALREIDPRRLFLQPYGRIIVVHLAILGGGLLMVLLSLPRLTAVLLVLIKLGFELRGKKPEALLLGDPGSRPQAGGRGGKGQGVLPP